MPFSQRLPVLPFPLAQSGELLAPQLLTLLLTDTSTRTTLPTLVPPLLLPVFLHLQSQLCSKPWRQVPGANELIISAALEASHWSYARAYRLGWWSVVPFVALAIASVACMSGVKDLMTEHVEATVEHDDVKDHGKEKSLEK
jgi:hypothetical protein